MVTIRFMPLGRRLAALAAALIVAALPARPAAQPPARLVAMGDIHGADAAFAQLLVRTGLTDAAGKWTGGSTVFVQTGDYMDRGAGTRRVLDRLMAIEEAARRGGGRAVILLGNHEVMNILRTFTDVTPEIFATFADGRSERRRQQAYEEQLALAKQSDVAALQPA
jgi:Calcineurin-like phosphoesterase